MRRERFFAVGVALRVEEHIARGFLRRHFAKIDRRHFAIFSAQHHKAAAAKITGLRMRHRQREAHRDRRIHRVTALL